MMNVRFVNVHNTFDVFHKTFRHWNTLIILFVSSNFISEEYMKVIILSAKSALTNEFLFTTILSRSSFNNSIVQ